MVPQADPISEFVSRLSLNYSVADLNLASTSLFTKAGYYQQSFTIDTSISLFDLYSTLAFVPAAVRTDFWLVRVDTAMAGIFFTYTFVLEYLSAANDFGSGAEFRIATQLPDHISIVITSLFGLEENLAEVYGWVYGSGYDIVDRPNLHAVTFTSAKVEASGLRVNSCPLDLTITFTKQGFESILFDLRFAPANLPIKFDLEVEFTVTGKSVVLYPSVSLGQVCLDIYAHIIPWALTPDGTSMTQLSIDGIGLKCEIGPTVFSGLIATNNIYRPRTAINDIPLRAHNYVVEPDPFLAVHYVKTDYDAVFSFEWRDESWFAVDFYTSKTFWGLFGLALITAEAGAQLCDQINWEIAMAFGVAAPPTLTFALEIHF